MRSLTIAIVALIIAACGDESNPDAGVWMSDDGFHWSQITDPSLRGQGIQQMLAVGHFGDQVVSVGYSSIDEDADGRVWLSSDGFTWDVVDDPDLGGPGDQWITAVTEGGPGLVAVGFETEFEGRTHPDGVIWTSGDGVDWIRVSPPASMAGRGPEELWAVLEFGGHLLAAGTDSGNAAVWESTDGVEWNRVKGPNRFLGSSAGGALIRDLTLGGPGVVAVGQADDDAAIWVSPDGETWTRVDNPGVLGGDRSQGIHRVIDSRLGLVAVGFDWGKERINFLGRGSADDMDAVVWISDDGFQWRRIDDTALGGPGFQELTAIIEWQDRLIAVGRDIAGGVTLNDPRANVDAAIWISEDARSWSKIEEPSLGGSDWQDIYGIAPLGSRVIAVGGDDAGVTRP